MSTGTEEFRDDYSKGWVFEVVRRFKLIIIKYVAKAIIAAEVSVEINTDRLAA